MYSITRSENYLSFVSFSNKIQTFLRQSKNINLEEINWYLLEIDRLLKLYDYNYQPPTNFPETYINADRILKQTSKYCDKLITKTSYKLSKEIKSLSLLLFRRYYEKCDYQKILSKIKDTETDSFKLVLLKTINEDDIYNGLFYFIYFLMNITSYLAEIVWFNNKEINPKISEEPEMFKYIQYILIILALKSLVLVKDLVDAFIEIQNYIYLDEEFSAYVKEQIYESNISLNGIEFEGILATLEMFEEEFQNVKIF